MIIGILLGIVIIFLLMSNGEVGKGCGCLMVGALGLLILAVIFVSLLITFGGGI